MKTRLEWLGEHWEGKLAPRQIKMALRSRFSEYRAFFEPPAAFPKPSSTDTDAPIELFVVDCSDISVVGELASKEGNLVILAWVPDTLSIDDPEQRALLEALVYGCLRELELLCISRGGGWDLIPLDLPGREADTEEIEQVASWIVETRTLWYPHKTTDDAWLPCCRAVGYGELEGESEEITEEDTPLKTLQDKELSERSRQRISTEARMNSDIVRPQVFARSDACFTVSQALHLHQFTLMRQLWGGYSSEIDPPPPMWPEPGAPDAAARKRLREYLANSDKIEGTDFFSFVKARNCKPIAEISTKQPEHILKWLGYKIDQENAV